MSQKTIWALALSWMSCSTMCGADLDNAFFESKIRPVLVQHCYGCHSAEAANRGKLKAGLLLDSRDGLLKGGDSGPAIQPTQPDRSLLAQSLMHQDGAPEMPPTGKLPQTVIDDFIAWIRSGAPDPRVDSTPTPKRGMSIEESRKFWSLQPPISTAPPTTANIEWSGSTIDRFVVHKLDDAGLTPVAAADNSVWLRRVFFDLIGLPPTVEQLDAFERDDSRGARTTIVDQLLSSPQFGQRWGRHWLDGVRYADSNGRDRNVFWYHAWRYRDYVIAAYNDDKPYDEFVREQISGDLMPASTPERGDELKIATALLALGPKAFEEQKAEVFRMDVIDEQIEVIGRTILGLSIGCARCHDHKFDPIPTRDYYALAGILRSTQPLYGYGPKGIKATNHHHTQLVAVGPDAATLSKTGLDYIEHLNQLTLIQNTARSDRYRIVRRVADAKLQLTKPDADRAKLLADIAQMEAEIKEWDLTVRAAEDDLQCAMQSPPPMPGWTMGARERPAVENCRIHVRGDTTNLGDTVERGVLQALPNAAPQMPKDQSGRMELAHWLTSRDNPLTARVYVNRVWLHLFGRGLVSTPDDYGVNGAVPSHPELLDYLAMRFMDLGWSTKHLIREIVLSRAYASGSTRHAKNEQIDPDNVFLWRMPPRRLEAEIFRDAILATSGRLDGSLPRKPASVFAKLHQWRDVEYRNFSPEFAPEQIEHPLRSVYLPVVRGVLPPIFQLFDFAAPDRPVAQRDESTVPSQSLFLLNNKWLIQQAEYYATSVLEMDFADDAARVRWLYRSALARYPTHDEVSEVLEYLRSGGIAADQPAGQSSTSQRFDRWTNLCQAMIASAEFRNLR